jgi:hypothetical protein
MTLNLISSTGVQPGDADRELVRQALIDGISAEWPDYIQDLISSGRLNPVSS